MFGKRKSKEEKARIKEEKRQLKELNFIKKQKEQQEKEQEEDDNYYKRLKAKSSHYNYDYNSYDNYDSYGGYGSYGGGYRSRDVGYSSFSWTSFVKPEPFKHELCPLIGSSDQESDESSLVSLVEGKMQNIIIGEDGKRYTAQSIDDSLTENEGQEAEQYNEKLKLTNGKSIPTFLTRAYARSLFSSSLNFDITEKNFDITQLTNQAAYPSIRFLTKNNKYYSKIFLENILSEIENKNNSADQAIGDELRQVEQDAKDGKNANLSEKLKNTIDDCMSKAIEKSVKDINSNQELLSMYKDCMSHKEKVDKEKKESKKPGESGESSDGAGDQDGSNTIDLENLDTLIHSSKNISISKKEMTKLVNKTIKTMKNVFGSGSRAKEESLFEADDIDDLEELHSFHPELMSALIEDISIIEKNCSTSYDIYIDVSGSMGEELFRINDKRITRADFSKIISYAFLKMNILANVYTFDTSVKKANMLEVLTHDFNGGTTIDKVFNSILETKRPSIIITDAEDTFKKELVDEIKDLACLIFLSKINEQTLQMKVPHEAVRGISPFVKQGRLFSVHKNKLWQAKKEQPDMNKLIMNQM